MRKILTGMGVAAMAFATVLSAQTPVSFSHDPIECISAACGRASVDAKVESSVPLKSVRVYFNDGSGSDYYVEMLHGGDWNFKAILPAVSTGTSAVTYRIVAIAEDGTVYEGPTNTASVTADCAPTPLTEEQMSLAMNTAIGLTDNGQSGSPQGFSCAGLVRVISPAEVMSGNTACEEVKLAKTDPCMMAGADAPAQTADAGTGGGNKKVYAYTAAGVAVAVGGAIIYDQNKDDGPVSPSRP